MLSPLRLILISVLLILAASIVLIWSPGPKYLPGDCIRHIGIDNPIDYYIIDNVGDHYRLGILEEGALTLILNHDPSYSLKSYLDRFYEKAPCESGININNVEQGEDPMAPLRKVMMEQDLAEGKYK